MPADVMLVAATTGLFGSAFAWNVTAPVEDDSSVPALEKTRRATLRQQSKVYRSFEKPVNRLAVLFSKLPQSWLASAKRSLTAQGEECWTAPEALAARTLPLIPAAMIAGLLVSDVISPVAGLSLTLAIILLAPLLILRDLRRKAAARMKAIRNRLPDTLDLMALVLEAGAGTLHDCLRFAAAENADHPLGDELRRLLFGIETGGRPVDQFRALAGRLTDPDIEEMAVALVTSEERGLPLKETLRTLSERLRSRQVQWMEAEAEEARVRIVGPAMLIMLGCLLIITAPWVISFVV